MENVLRQTLRTRRHFCQADQLVVQGMMASRYLAQFEEVVSGWQTQLSMVRCDIVQSFWQWAAHMKYASFSGRLTTFP